MSTLTRRGPNANAPARLPGIQAERVADANTRLAIEALREWVEVRLGSRGDYYERAVTFRDLAQVTTDLANLQKQVDRLPAGTASTQSTPAPTADLSNINNAIAQLQESVIRLTAQVQALINLPAAVLALQASAERAAYLDEFNVFTRNLTSEPVFIAPDADDTIFYDVEASRVFLVNLNTDLSIATPDNLRDGVELVLFLQQDSIGGWSATFTSDYDFGNDVVPILNDDAGGITVIRGIYVEDIGKIICTVQVGGSAFTRAIGFASGVSSATAVASGSVGSSFGSGAASAVGSAVIAATGSASGTSDASAAQNTTTGSSSGSSTATAFTNQGVGSASGTSTTTGLS